MKINEYIYIYCEYVRDKWVVSFGDSDKGEW